MENKTQAQECCPKFNPEKWDKKTFDWVDKKFIKDSMPTFFHIPFPPMIGKKITRMWKATEETGADASDKEEVLMLFHDPSAFRSEIFVSVEKDVPTERNVTISGTFEAKVFDGGYDEVPKFMKIMDQELAQKGKKAKDYYIHYAYCPKCAKKFGNNYMILFAQV